MNKQESSQMSTVDTITGSASLKAGQAHVSYLAALRYSASYVQERRKLYKVHHS